MLPSKQVPGYLDHLALQTAESDPVRAAELSLLRSIQQQVEVLVAIGAIALVLLGFIAFFRPL